jgi:hypothetical protein
MQILILPITADPDPNFQRIKSVAVSQPRSKLTTQIAHLLPKNIKLFRRRSSMHRGALLNLKFFFEIFSPKYDSKTKFKFLLILQNI